ncbi:uncharacterized protein PV06_11262 [Exophiala oligosperma]|uniref:Major facilitator superfamily (MFS) profile domain-containing protein n=1 Tax=Exophiala oligosperma TaxID=215243 RepID=A0A0D2D2Q2_9EURO|nr:uncharacterized protein PV06_11262 [Exophiala oligosperma]KIW36495.1 hypothetical protein PV06_11262 [Exophiala oligosperma]
MNTTTPEAHGANGFVPGTVHLVDMQGVMQTKHAKGAENDIVLVPQPSTHPDDPLNWPSRRKLLSVFCMSTYVLVTGICSSALYSTLDPLSEATGISIADLNAGTGYMFLAFGWGCLLWQAIALQYGKRPVYLISLLGTMAIMVWQPYIRSNGQWIVAKLLQGVFGSPIESLGEISVSDVFFTHERGRYLAVYALALGYSNGIAPLIMAFITSGQGWRWVFYWCAIFSAGAFVILFFCLEETNFDRPSVTGMEESAAIGGTLTASTDEAGPQTADLESRVHQHGDNKSAALESSGTEQAHGDVELVTKSYLAKLRPFQPGVFRRKCHLGLLMLRPLQLTFLPIVAYAGFLYGCNIIWLSVLNATESLVLSRNPYNFATWQVGLTFIAPIVGTTLGSLYTGLFGDWLIVKLARRNGGYFEAEFRLWLFVLLLVLIPFGNILWGVGAEHDINWFGLVFAMGTISFTTTSGSQASIAYLIDAYRDLSGEALVTVIIIRNTMSFGIGYAVTPWVVNLGYQNAFLLAAFIGLAHNLTIFPVMKWGRELRRRSATTYWRYLESAREKGISH